MRLNRKGKGLDWSLPFLSLVVAASQFCVHFTVEHLVVSALELGTPK